MCSDNINNTTQTQHIESLIIHGITDKTANLPKSNNKIMLVVSSLITCFFMQSIVCNYTTVTLFHVMMQFTIKPVSNHYGSGLSESTFKSNCD